MGTQPGTFPLLPYGARRAGLALIAAILLAGLARKAGAFVLSPEGLEQWRVLMKSAMLLALLLVAGARHRTESVARTELRLRSLVRGFLWGALYVLLQPLTGYIIGGLPSAQSGQDAVLMMLFAYFVFYYVAKWTNRK